MIRKYQATVYKTVFAVLHDRKDAEDVTQEVFIRMYHALSQYESRGFKTWLSRIAVNKAIDFKRKRERSKVTAAAQVDRDPQAEDSAESRFIRMEKQRDIRTRIQELPAKYRAVVYDYYFLEKSYRQIAEERGVKVKTVESTLYRARKWMQKHWKREDFDDAFQ